MIPPAPISLPMKTKLRMTAAASLVGALPLLAACSVPTVNPGPPEEDDAPRASYRTQEVVNTFSFQGCAHEYTVVLPDGWEGYEDTYVPANTGINGGGIHDDKGNSVVIGCYTQPGLSVDQLKQDATANILAAPQVATPGTISAETASTLGELAAHEYLIAYDINVSQKVRVTVLDPGTDQSLALIASGSIHSPEAQEQVTAIIDSIEIL